MTDSKIILALDYHSESQAKSLLKQLHPRDCRIKIGKELFLSAGPSFVEYCIAKNFDVFLDLKFHDIPHTVSKACTVAAQLGVWMLDVHISGGHAMLSAACEALAKFSPKPYLIGVTILTSLTDIDLEKVGFKSNVPSTVLQLATLAQTCGLDGVVCSAQEVNMLASLGKSFKKITPGIRLKNENPHDQIRVWTPEQAIAAGADYLVIGRAITESNDPKAQLDVLNHIIQSLENDAI